MVRWWLSVGFGLSLACMMVAAAFAANITGLRLRVWLMRGLFKMGKKVLSGEERLRFQIGRIINVAYLLFFLAFLLGLGSALLLFKGFLWQGFLGFALLGVLLVLLQYNVNAYFQKNGGVH